MVAVGAQPASAVAMFAFEFYNHSRWMVMVNPANALVRSALGAMDRQASSLFLLVQANQVTVFGSDIGEHNVVGLADNQSLIWQANTSESEYEKAVALDAAQPHFRGASPMRWICRDPNRYLDLTNDAIDLANPGGDS